jgi:hypothetical protein
LWQALEGIIDRRGDAIARLLQDYGVPLLPLDRAMIHQVKEL